MEEGIYLGSHINLKAPDFYLGTVQTALSWGENTFMFYTGAPQNTMRVPVERMRIEEGRALLREKGIDEGKLVVHAPYIINLGNRDNSRVYDLGKSFLVEELRRVEAFHIGLLTLHPGAETAKKGVEFGLDSIVEGLNEVLSKDGTKVKIGLETMAGKGSELGKTFEEIAYIISHCAFPERLGVTLDTCHINDAGYDENDVDGILSHFDATIGLNRLIILHLNDSKNPLGSHKDRHENIGHGTLGFETIRKWVTHPLLKGIPKILETPYYGEKPPYKKEIEMLRSGVYEENWRDLL